jgi:DnaD/phage-associated family protein
MTEKQNDYTTEQEVQEALEMLGKGHSHEPRKIIQEISGFYPLFEVLLERYGDLITPSVFGVVWRFCQMKDGVCKASLRKMAEILNVDAATFMRRLQVLCDDGYLIDTTPDARNKPHIYADTGMVVMTSNTGVRVETVAHRNSSAKATVAHNNKTVAHSQLIKDSIKGFDEDEALASISKAYESEIGPLTPMIADDLKDAAKTYPLQWALDAIHEAAVQNKRGWKYCLAILERWKRQGNQQTAKPARTNGRSQRSPEAHPAPTGKYLTADEVEAKFRAEGLIP